MVFNYCPKCGEKCGKKEIGDEGLIPYCVSCEKVLFNFFYTCVLCFVVDEKNNVVLTQGMVDGKLSGNYGGVAGFIKEGESAEDAAKREVKEEIGLTVSTLKYMKSYSRNKDMLMIIFICMTENSELTISEKELYSAKWFTKDEVKHIIREYPAPWVEVLNSYLENNNE